MEKIAKQSEKCSTWDENFIMIFYKSQYSTKKFDPKMMDKTPKNDKIVILGRSQKGFLKIK